MASSLKDELRRMGIQFSKYATKSELQELLDSSRDSKTDEKSEKSVKVCYEPVVVDFKNSSLAEAKMLILSMKDREGVRNLILRGDQPSATRFTDCPDYCISQGSIDIFRFFPKLESIEIACNYIDDDSFHRLREGYPTLKKVKFGGKYIEFITVETLISLSACRESLEYFENGKQEFESHEWDELLRHFSRGALKGIRVRSAKGGSQIVM